MSANDSIEAVQSVLGSPAEALFTEPALKVRRNLLVAIVAVILATMGEVALDQEASVFGLKFRGLTSDIIQVGLLIVTVYLLFHFAWYVCEAFIEWRLRVTGTRLAFVTGARVGSTQCDYPDDPRQSTLYSWWAQQAKQIGNLSAQAHSIEQQMEDTKAAVDGLIANGGNQINLDKLLTSLSQLKNSVVELNRSTKAVSESLEAHRIPASLQRFDKWFQLFLRSQNLRWLLIEVLMPLIAGVFALYLLLK